MQKKLIALAIAGLSSAAFAQSNVTVYGVVDLAQENIKATGATAAPTTTVDSNVLSQNRMAQNSSHLGFKGAEDLGGGMKAVFQIETSVAADAGGAAGAFTGVMRDTFVGLTGGFGTVLAGNLTHPLRVFGTKADFNPGNAGIGFMGAVTGTLNLKGLSAKTGADDRAANALAYITPTVSGFHGVLAYVNGENRKNAAQNSAGAAVTGSSIIGAFVPNSVGTTTAGTQDRDARQWQVAGVYDNGPLFVGLGYHRAYDAFAATLGGGVKDDAKVTRLAAAYSFPSKTTVSAMWDSTKLNVVSATNTYEAKRNAWSLAVKQGFGASSVYLEYGKANNATGTLADLTCGTGNSCDTGVKMWTLGYTYDLSKRTMIKAYYAAITNNKDAAQDFYNNPVGLVAGGATTANNGQGADPRGLGIGLRHSF